MKIGKLRNIIKESIKELMTEQAGNCVKITFSMDCPGNPNQGTNITGQSDNNRCTFIGSSANQTGQIPQVGDGFRFGGPNDIFKVISVTPNPNGTSNQYYDAAACGTGSTGSTGCSLQDFQNATSNVSGLPAPFLQNIHNNYKDHSNPCRFLSNRRAIQAQGSTNPRRAAQKAAKVQALDLIIAQCCN